MFRTDNLEGLVPYLTGEMPSGQKLIPPTVGYSKLCVTDFPPSMGVLLGRHWRVGTAGMSNRKQFDPHLPNSY